MFTAVNILLWDYSILRVHSCELSPLLHGPSLRRGKGLKVEG
jgi:hypothetical protein